jgi:hypothetical protein
MRISALIQIATVAPRSGFDKRRRATPRDIREAHKFADNEKFRAYDFYYGVVMPDKSRRVRTSNFGSAIPVCDCIDAGMRSQKSLRAS